MDDVIVVGAGPSGSAAAIRLKECGVSSVRLLDRSTFPREKTCGSGLSPNALKLVRQLGVADEVAAHSAPILSVKVVTPGGRDMVLASNAAAVVCARSTFDDILKRRAEALGAQFEGGVRATALLREGERVTGVQLADGRTLRARMVLCADGAHSIFSTDPRPRRSISTLMGWWENFRFTPGQIDMIFDRELAPLYGWMFPETTTRVNIGICIDGQDEHGEKTQRNVREVFESFLQRHYAEQLRDAQPVGRWKGHPIVYTTWIDRCTAPGAIYLGEAVRITHPATGEGISQAMQSGIYAAETAAEILRNPSSERRAQQAYLWRQRRRFTLGQVAGHALRGVVRTPVLDAVAKVFDQPIIRSAAVRFLGSALAGSAVSETSARQPDSAPTRAAR